jgi:hypothetical protein
MLSILFQRSGFIRLATHFARKPGLRQSPASRHRDFVSEGLRHTQPLHRGGSRSPEKIARRWPLSPHDTRGHSSSQLQVLTTVCAIKSVGQAKPRRGQHHTRDPNQRRSHESHEISTQQIHPALGIVLMAMNSAFLHTTKAFIL